MSMMNDAIIDIGSSTNLGSIHRVIWCCHLVTHMWTSWIAF